jgi:hypothetical protein
VIELADTCHKALPAVAEGGERGVTTSQSCDGSRLVDRSLIPATLEAVHRCPARSDYIELCFETDEGGWTWCLPDPIEQSQCDTSCSTLAVTVGPYGARARCVDGGRLGFTLSAAEAVPLIVGGARTYVARKLVERGW